MDGRMQGSYSLVPRTAHEEIEEMVGEEANRADRGGRLHQVQMGLWDHGGHTIHRLPRRLFSIRAQTSSKAIR